MFPMRMFPMAMARASQAGSCFMGQLYVHLKKALLNNNSPLMVLVFPLDSYRKAVRSSTF
jgi:hypothetical protein